MINFIQVNRDTPGPVGDRLRQFIKVMQDHDKQEAGEFREIDEVMNILGSGEWQENIDDGLDLEGADLVRIIENLLAVIRGTDSFMIYALDDGYQTSYFAVKSEGELLKRLEKKEEETQA